MLKEVVHLFEGKHVFSKDSGWFLQKVVHALKQIVNFLKETGTVLKEIVDFPSGNLILRVRGNRMWPWPRAADGSSGAQLCE